MNREVKSLYVVAGEESLHNDEYSISQSVCQQFFEKILIFYLRDKRICNVSKDNIIPIRIMPVWFSMGILLSLPLQQSKSKSKTHSVCRYGKEIATQNSDRFVRINTNIAEIPTSFSFVTIVCRHGKQIAPIRFKDFAVTAKLSQTWLLHHYHSIIKKSGFAYNNKSD